MHMLLSQDIPGAGGALNSVFLSQDGFKSCNQLSFTHK
jgi:hypothetical protein